jgi:uncharacterized iron-regulated protein
MQSIVIDVMKINAHEKYFLQHNANSMCKLLKVAQYKQLVKAMHMVPKPINAGNCDYSKIVNYRTCVTNNDKIRKLYIKFGDLELNVKH